MDDKFKIGEAGELVQPDSYVTAEEADSYVVGALKRIDTFTLSGKWDDEETPTNEYSFSMLPSSVAAKYSNTFVTFKALMPDGAVGDWQMWFPIRDRRLARRIARREGMRFSKVGRQYVMRKKP